MKYNRRVEFSVKIQGTESLYIETRIDMPEEYLEKCEFEGLSSYTGKGLELREKIWEELRQ